MAALAAIPAFDGYPYLVTLVVKSLCHLALLPPRDSYDVLRDVARRQVAANRLQSCLVIDRPPTSGAVRWTRSSSGTRRPATCSATSPRVASRPRPSSV